MADKAHKYLIDWIINFLRNKDLLLKKIELVKKNKDGFDVYVKFKESLNSKSSNCYESSIRNKEQFFIVKPLVDDVDKVLSKFDNEVWGGLVVLNTANNFDVLVKNWDKFVKFKHLCVYFVNPFSQLDKKWVIYPYTHNNICEKDALEKGLRTMFEMVEVLTEEQIKDTF